MKTLSGVDNRVSDFSPVAAVTKVAFLRQLHNDPFLAGVWYRHFTVDAVE